MLTWEMFQVIPLSTPTVLNAKKSLSKDMVLIFKGGILMITIVASSAATKLLSQANLPKTTSKTDSSLSFRLLLHVQVSQ